MKAVEPVCGKILISCQLLEHNGRRYYRKVYSDGEKDWEPEKYDIPGLEKPEKLEAIYQNAN